jgi:DNA repair exonuclease SbcCD nuclease subunit
VFIAPGNHDYVRPESPYAQAGWPDNVHIFLDAKLSQISLPELDCRIYGAGYEAMDCPALLKGFHAAGPEKHHLGILHAEVEASGSAYCPISRDQLRNCGLSYLALGHIHKSGSLRAGDTLCAWPGCPMGHGYDELGAKGVIILTIEDQVSASFLPLDTPRFYDLEVDMDHQELEQLLPAVDRGDFYRVTLTGSTGAKLEQLKAQFAGLRNLEFVDNREMKPDPWERVDEDTLEGSYFRLLQNKLQEADDAQAEVIQLAADLSRAILDGKEVVL